jgi:hypothetical protein
MSENSFVGPLRIFLGQCEAKSSYQGRAKMLTGEGSGRKRALLGEHGGSLGGRVRLVRERKWRHSEGNEKARVDDGGANARS